MATSEPQESLTEAIGQPVTHTFGSCEEGIQHRDSTSTQHTEQSQEHSGVLSRTTRRCWNKLFFSLINNASYNFTLIENCSLDKVMRQDTSYNDMEMNRIKMKINWWVSMPMKIKINFICPWQESCLGHQYVGDSWAAGWIRALFGQMDPKKDQRRSKHHLNCSWSFWRVGHLC